jgi:hypothetical protein
MGKDHGEVGKGLREGGQIYQNLRTNIIRVACVDEVFVLGRHSYYISGEHFLE